MDRCHLCRDDIGPTAPVKTGKFRACERCSELLRAPPCNSCGKPVRDANRNDPEPYHELCRRCKSCNQVIPRDDVVKLAGHLLCSSCEHLFGKFFLPKHRSQAERMKEAFEAWDNDGSGSIEIAELRRVMKALDPDFADRDLGKLFSMIDVNRSGVIEYEEFCQWIMKGMPLDIREDGFERFVTELMRSAGAAAQQAEMEIVEVQLRPDGLLFVRKCGDESFVTRALRSPMVSLSRLDPEEFICKVECTERGLILTMNTGRVALVRSEGRLFGPWQAPEGFHIVGLRTKPADAAKASTQLGAEPVAEVKRTRKFKRAQTVPIRAPNFADEELPTSVDDTEFERRRSSECIGPKALSGAPWLDEGHGDVVVGIDVAPLPAAKSYDAAASLRFAAEHDFLYTLQRMLAKAAVDVNSFGPGGVTALMLASQHGNIGAMRLLLGSKASPSIADPDGWTALTFASRCGQTTGVQILLERSASLEGDGGSALHEALRHQHNSAARALLRAGILPQSKGTFALEEALDEARFQLHVPVIKPAGSVFSTPVTVEILPGESPPESEEEPEEDEEEGAEDDEEEREAKAAARQERKRRRSELEREKRARFSNEPPLRIFYTLDGRNPFTVGRPYKGPVTLSDARTHLRAVAVQGYKRSVVCEEIFVVCHYAMPDDVVSGELMVHAFPESTHIVAESIARTLGEPIERVCISSDAVEGSESGWWLRVPVRDPRPRHCLFIDRSFSVVRGSKLKEFTEKVKSDMLQATGEMPEDIEVRADLRAGRSAHKAGSIAVEFTLPRQLAEEIKRQLEDSSSFLLSKAKHRSFLSDATLEVVETLNDRLADRGLREQLRELVAKKAAVDQVIGFGTTQDSDKEGIIAIGLQKSEAKKLKERGFLQKCIQTIFPNTQLGEVLEGPDGLCVEYTVDIISGKKDQLRDGHLVAKELNADEFPERLMSEMAQMHLPLKAAVSMRATTRQLSQLEFHLEWKFQELEDGQGQRKDFIDGICMLYSGGNLSQVIDFRSAHEDRQVHDGRKTEETASLCRSIQRAVQHSGDIMSDVGGEHRVALDLDALPPSVTDLFFVLAAFDCNDLSLFKDTAVEIHDVVLGRQLTSYRLDSQVNSQAVVMCSFTKDPDHGKWVVHGLGYPSEGNAKDYEPIKTTIASRCQADYSRWERRQHLVKLRVLQKCKRLTASSSNDCAIFMWRVLDLPINTFQLVVLWL